MIPGTILIATAIAMLLLGVGRSAARAISDFRAQGRQHSADECADWLGADAGGSFNIHDGSVSE